jgi:hypothetical protein
MRQAIAGAALALFLAACSTAPEDTPPPPSAPRPVAPPPAPPAAPRDACGAWQLQHLVGRPRSEIPVPVEPGRQRVACTTCPVTQDYSPQRLNFFFDADTGVIREIRCG